MAEQANADFCAGVSRLLDSKVNELTFTSLRGGVSSDIWRVDAPGLTVCAKRALAQLRVAATWTAPVERNREEVRWLRYAAGVIPGQVPEVIAHDAREGIILLSWFDPSDWLNFKTLLLGRQASETSPEALNRCAGQLGALLARVHRASEQSPELEREFRHFEYFNALRLDPFLRFTADRHPRTSVIMQALTDVLSRNRCALVHGDVSPKNVLTNNRGEVVLLDAECACWGNPAFDVAFMLTHLLLKIYLSHRTGSVSPETNSGLGSSLALSFWQAYRTSHQHGNEHTVGLENTASLLLPALLLARVDGKSPVEYLNAEEKKDIRRRSLALLLQQDKNPLGLAALITQWCADC